MFFIGGENKIKLAIGLVVKGGGEYIDQWLKSIEKLADVILVVDNDADDKVKDTLIIHPKVKQYLIQKNMERNMSRDYQKVLDMAREEDCNWILNLDIDETLIEFDPDILKQYLLNVKETSVGFPLFEMRGDDNHYVMIKDCSPNLKHARLCHKCYKVQAHFEFNQKDIHGNSIPHNCLPGQMIPISIKHYGHLTKKSIIKKLKYYKEHSFKDMEELGATWMEIDDNKVEIKDFGIAMRDIFPLERFFKKCN